MGGQRTVQSRRNRVPEAAEVDAPNASRRDSGQARAKRARDRVVRSLSVLSHEACFAWVCSPEDEAPDDRRVAGAMSPVLAELGKIADVGTLKRMAAGVCQRRLPPADAVRFVRQEGLDRGANAASLQRSVIRCVEDFLARYPAVTRRQACEALRAALEEYEQAAVASPAAGPAPEKRGRKGKGA